MPLDSDSDSASRPRFKIRRHESGSDSDEAGNLAGPLAAGLLLGIFVSEQVRLLATRRPLKRRRQRRRKRKESVAEISMHGIGSPSTTDRSIRSQHDESNHTNVGASARNVTFQGEARQDRDHINHERFEQLSEVTSEDCSSWTDNGPKVDDLVSCNVNTLTGSKHETSNRNLCAKLVSSRVYSRVRVECAYMVEYRAEMDQISRDLDWKPSPQVGESMVKVQQMRRASTSQQSSAPKWRVRAFRSGGLADLCHL